MDGNHDIREDKESVPAQPYLYHGVPVAIPDKQRTIYVQDILIDIQLGPAITDVSYWQGGIDIVFVGVLIQKINKLLTDS